MNNNINNNENDIIRKNNLSKLYFLYQKTTIPLSNINKKDLINFKDIFDEKIYKKTKCIILDINEQKINKMNMDKKNFNILEKFYLNLNYFYISNLINFSIDKKIIKNTKELINENKLSLTNWINYREKNDTDYIFLPKNILKMGDNYINIKNYKILDSVEQEKIKIRGGIILDESNYFWIIYMVDFFLYLFNNCKSNLFNTLIICHYSVIEIFKQRLEKEKIPVTIININKNNLQFNINSINILPINFEQINDNILDELKN